MNRRGFLSLLAPAAALIAAPELLLPKRTFFLPPAGGWHSTFTDADLRDMCDALLGQAELEINPPFVTGVIGRYTGIDWYNGPITATEIIARNSQLAEALAPGLIHHGPGFFVPLT